MGERERVRNADVATIARIVCEQRKRGAHEHKVGQVRFDLTRVGWCARFVRQCHEAALGQAEHTWEFRAPSAAMMEYRLSEAGKAVDDPQPGDIVGMSAAIPRSRRNDWTWQKATRRYGHIGIYLGDGLLAENTSSRRRGPGTVVSPVSAVRDRITAYYRVLPSARESDEIAVRVMPEGRLIECRARLEEGVTRCDLRALAEGLGATVRFQRAEVRVTPSP